MSLFKNAVLAASLAMVAVPVANAYTIDFDDRTEQLVVVVDGNPRTIDGESVEVTSDQPGLFTAAYLLIVVSDSGTTDVSDVITVVVTPDATTGRTALDIVFTSDAEGPLAPPAAPPPGVTEEFITETGDFQTIYSSHDLSTQGNPDWVFRFASDVEPVPEPATTALLAIGLAGLGFSRRRKPH